MSFFTFREYTMVNARNLSEFAGFTFEEVKAVCEKSGVDFDECRLWYDAYRLGGYEIYNPKSVVMCAEDKKFRSYWSMTSTYTVVADRISRNFDGTKNDVIRMLSGENVDVDTGKYQNTMKSFLSRDDIFTYLIHVGYLAYNEDDDTCRITVIRLLFLP